MGYKIIKKEYIAPAIFSLRVEAPLIARSTP